MIFNEVLFAYKTSIIVDDLVCLILNEIPNI